jgi:hypothetical protein
MDMPMWRSRWVEATVAAALLAAGGAAWAQEPSRVLRLRTEKVTLHDCADTARKTEFARKSFQGSWPVVSGSPAPPPGFLRVKVGDEERCVRAYAVETDRPIAASAECGAVVGSLQPRNAATRGLGEECKK